LAQKPLLPLPPIVPFLSQTHSKIGKSTTATNATFLTFTTFMAENCPYGVAANAANADIKLLLTGAKSQSLTANRRFDED
jgi:hypothetical protein